MAKLKDILTNLISEAEAKPGKSLTTQLAGGMSVHVVVALGVLSLGVSRAGVSPSNTEMVTTLKHANAPGVNLKLDKWITGSKAGRQYVFTSWPLPVRLEEATQ